MSVTTVVKKAPDSLVVLPLSGISPRVGIAMGIRTAWALRQAGYPARHLTVSDGVSPVLTGWITQASTSGDIIWLDIDWAAYGSNGNVLGKYTQNTAVPRSGWERLSTETLGAILVEAMPGIDGLVRLEMFPPGTDMAQPTMPQPGMLGPLSQNDDTIIVSGFGIAKVDETGREVWEPLMTVTGEIGAVPLVNPSQKVQLIDPSIREKEQEKARTTFVSEGLTDEYVESINTDIPSANEIAGLPPRDPEPEESSEKYRSSLPIEETDDVNAVTGQLAAPVSPAPGVIQKSTPPATAAFGAASYRPVFLVRQAIGAPGDGNLVLRDAMRKALRNNDAMVTDDLSKASHIVQGTVRVEVPFAGTQRVRIVWMITNTGGLEMGTALQENDVPEGSLDQPWGGVAQKIADSAVLGIAQLFDTGLDAGGLGGHLSQPDLPHLQ